MCELFPSHTIPDLNNATATILSCKEYDQVLGVMLRVHEIEEHLRATTIVDASVTRLMELCGDDPLKKTYVFTALAEKAGTCMCPNVFTFALHRLDDPERKKDLLQKYANGSTFVGQYMSRCEM